MVKLSLNHGYKAVLFFLGGGGGGGGGRVGREGRVCLLVERSNLAYNKPEELHSTFLKLSRDCYQKIDILRNWLHLLAERPNLAIIKLEVLQSIFSKWSRDWYLNVNILQTWLHKFCPNLIWAIDIKAVYWSKDRI